MQPGEAANHVFILPNIGQMTQRPKRGHRWYFCPMGSRKVKETMNKAKSDEFYQQFVSDECPPEDAQVFAGFAAEVQEYLSDTVRLRAGIINHNVIRLTMAINGRSLCAVDSYLHISEVRDINPAIDHAYLIAERMAIRLALRFMLAKEPVR